VNSLFHRRDIEGIGIKTHASQQWTNRSGGEGDLIDGWLSARRDDSNFNAWIHASPTYCFQFLKSNWREESQFYSVRSEWCVQSIRRTAFVVISFRLITSRKPQSVVEHSGKTDAIVREQSLLSFHSKWISFWRGSKPKSVKADEWELHNRILRMKWKGCETLTSNHRMKSRFRSLKRRNEWFDCGDMRTLSLMLLSTKNGRLMSYFVQMERESTKCVGMTLILMFCSLWRWMIWNDIFEINW
jgi:hypothetical protein